MYLSRLRDLREDAELNQTQLAEKLGVAQTIYSGYERGFRDIPLDVLCLIADFYHTSTDYILERTDNPAPPAP
ncbi:MAG TPA: helix-turn-helix domain-containing protein [Candidatus Agathobaculum merdigallinarum]|nr:helix-turn-helix domain-containing protein [Candidatus Agathobaculum merdigallinarum]